MDCRTLYLGTVSRFMFGDIIYLSVELTLFFCMHYLGNLMGDALWYINQSYSLLK